MGDLKFSFLYFCLMRKKVINIIFGTFDLGETPAINN